MVSSTTSSGIAGAAFLLLYAVLAVPLLWRGEALPEMAGVSTILAIALASLSAIDVARYQLPDVITLPLTGLGLLVSWWIGTMPLWWSTVSAAAGFLLLVIVRQLYLYVRKRAGLGLGDAKLLAASGAWLGAELLPTVLLWATGAALACVLVAAFRGSMLTGATRIPFGPFLCFGIWLTWLYGGIQ
jgi:leader peptidase (prepilin peptidase)/N-methyltransferase